MEYDQQLFGDFELFRVFALLGDITPTFSRNNCSELFRVFVSAFFPATNSCSLQRLLCISFCFRNLSVDFSISE